MLISTRNEFEKALEAIYGQQLSVVDVETNGVEIWKGDKICGVGVCTEQLETFYFPFRHIENELPMMDLFTSEPLNLPIEWMEELWECLYTVKCLIGHNIKFDLAAMWQDGFDLKPDQILEDTIAGGRLILQERFARMSLENLTTKLVGPSEWKTTLREYFKDRRIPKRYDMVEPSVMAEYCEGDVKNTLLVRNKMIEFVDSTDQRRVWDQEQELIRYSLWPMEKHGLFYDLKYCNDRIPKINSRLDTLAKEIYEMVGGEFDIASTAQLDKKLETLGIRSTSLTKSGQPQWDSSSLLNIEHPIGNALLEWRGLEKQRSVYFEPLLTWPTPYLHPSFKSWGTVTGRLSCQSPNLQNLARGILNIGGDGASDLLSDEAMAAVKAQLSINKAGSNTTDAKAGTGTLTSFLSYGKSYDDLNEETALSTRRLYVAPPGFSMYLMDFSQMEMRVFADYVNDPHLTELIEGEGFDFHDHVAAEVWKVDKTSSMWSFYRTLAKCINFGLLYGIGSEKLAGQMQVTPAEAQKYKQDYFARFPKAKQFIYDVKNTVHSKGFVFNRFGRRYYLTPEKDYVGVNYLIQGTSADIVKNRMVAISKYLRDYKSVMVAQVHDELIFYIHHSEEKFIVKILKDLVEERCIKTKLLVDVSKGFPSWAQKSKVCLECCEKLTKDHKCKEIPE